MKTVIHLPQQIKSDEIRRKVEDYVTRVGDVRMEVESTLPRDKKDSEVIVGLDREGRQLRTPVLHEWLLKKKRSATDVRFLIGGKRGLAGESRELCDWTWSLGLLVMNQFVAALVVAEQLYRCYTMRTNHPYH